MAGGTLIFDGNGLRPHCIGRVDENGLVFTGKGIKADCLGRVWNGQVTNAPGIGSEHIGSVDGDDCVYDASGVLLGHARGDHIYRAGSDEPVARFKGPYAGQAAAAVLLLLEPEDRGA